MTLVVRLCPEYIPLWMLGTSRISAMQRTSCNIGGMQIAQPCINDKVSCEYLDLVYSAHDLSMLSAGILWITIGSILLCWTLHRIYNLPSHIPPKPLTTIEPASARLRRTIGSAIRHFLLRDSIRPIFGHTTRLQVTVLLSLIGYLIIWFFVGLTYRAWVTPVKNLPGVYNTRTTLGPWSDRIGVLVYALTPLSPMLANWESVLSLLKKYHTRASAFYTAS